MKSSGVYMESEMEGEEWSIYEGSVNGMRGK